MPIAVQPGLVSCVCAWCCNRREQSQLRRTACAVHLLLFLATFRYAFSSFLVPDGFFQVSSIIPIHTIEIGYMLEQLAWQKTDLSMLDKETQNFIHLIKTGEKVRAKDMQRNLEIILQHAPDNGLGLHAGSRVRFSDVGAFGHAFLSSRNLRSAHKMILKYRTILSPVHGISIGYDQNTFVYAIENLRAEGLSARFFVECWLRSQHDIIKILLGTNARFESISFTYDPPPYEDIYREIFDCPIYYRQKLNSYRASNTLLDQPFSFANREVKVFCEKQCAQMMHEMESGEDTVMRARHALLKRPGWFPSSKELAGELGFSSRTFRRKLQKEDSNFQSVLDSVRKELATTYLQSTNLTVEMIADRLGYREPNSFYKAFRRWFGTSPKAFNQEETVPAKAVEER